MHHLKKNGTKLRLEILKDQLNIFEQKHKSKE